MSDTITIRKGLDLPIGGTAELRLTDARNTKTYAIKPTDFVGLTPRLIVEEGQAVRLGDALFCDKQDERIRFTSPVDGRVKAIVRGEKRKLLEVVVEADCKSAGSTGSDYKSSPTAEKLPETADEIKSAMLQCGLWPMLRQRPFGTIAHPDNKPKAIFVSAFDSAPLAPDYDFLLQGRENWFAKGLEALTKLTDGKVHVCFRPGQRLASLDCFVVPPRNDAKRVKQSPERANRTEAGDFNPRSQMEIHHINGPHPAGNIGTQIAHIDPINKGEVVWTMNAQDVAVLGELVGTGVYRPEKVVTVAGPQAKNPHYYRIIQGACVESLLAGQFPNADYPKMETETPEKGYRVISGNILSGTQIAADGFVGAYDSLISLLPEGNYYDFMGWLMPGFKKFSFSRAFLSGFMPPSSFRPMGIQLPRFERFWKFDTNTHGEERPLVFTGNFERVCPFDIYPTQLIKACIVGDIELMENLGIYEVEPEDFALCEFIDTSKTEIQPIIREALEKIRKEAL
ncbi:MAG: NADH:ubiquinone reductase (Na(+)-transporting) subunit A [Bacteroidales bacterium]|nr:NADH:ubiquinone reductase (Na(+)-transporting) subunit A [Bacteroidales bacterium]